MWRIGVIAGRSQDSAMWAPFHEALREFGYVEGQNIAFKWPSSGMRAERFADLATELAQLKVDVILASENPATAAAQRATVIEWHPICAGVPYLERGR